MIIVTGSPRSGTSMMMQTLIRLGLKTPAKKFTKEHNDIINYNVGGFYELGVECHEGINHQDYKGQAVKMFPPELYLTNQKYVDKIIVCVRDRDSTINSYRPIHKILNQDSNPEDIYDACYQIISVLITQKPHIFITFEDIINKPERIILSLCDFLNISPTSIQINDSIKNINYAINSSSSNRGYNSRDKRIPRI
jgi:hypothetical protein